MALFLVMYYTLVTEMKCLEKPDFDIFYTVLLPLLSDGGVLLSEWSKCGAVVTYFVVVH